MLGSILCVIIDFFSKRKLFFLLVFLLFCLVSYWGIDRIRVNESVFSILPKGSKFEEFSKLIKRSGLSSSIIFKLKVDGVESDELSELTSDLSDSLNYWKSHLKDIKIEREDIEQELFDHYYSLFPIFINEEYYLSIEEKIVADSLEKNLSNSYRTLVSPSGSFFKDFIIRDPLSITSNFFNDLNANSNFSDLSVDNGLVYTADGKYILITAKVSFDAQDNVRNIELYHGLNKLKHNWNNLHPNNNIDYFGTFQIAAENGIQIKRDTFLTMTITLSLILLILFIFYRKILLPIFFVLPLVFGALFALGLLGFFRPNVSGISLATGAVAFGIILDYSFHFFTHLRHTKSINQTVKEICFPLLTGSFTTVMAFLALLFTSSKVLQDFGLFAALSLCGAAAFTLVGLPVVLRTVGFKYNNQSRKEINLNITIPRAYRLPFITLIILLTGLFAYYSGDVKFDDNLENLGYHRSQLKESENEFVGINPEKEKKLYFFSESDSYEKSSVSNYQLYLKLLDLQSENKVKSFMSAGRFIIPHSIANSRIDRWNNYWLNKRDSLEVEFDKISENLGFSDNAFHRFKDWTFSYTDELPESSILDELGVGDLVHQYGSRTTFITTVVVEKELVQPVYDELMKIKGVEGFNRADVAKNLLTIVKDDFNYILLVSSLLVFLSLLLIYGRIEIAIFTFLPMFISWIWIVGLASLLDIRFNFVNIVIATFIFGLGDDFSIFITDGLLGRYKYGRNTLGSYNKAIILSALTTMVGTGALFFAKHPAIHSVSLISVLGIGCVLLISVVLQPFLFDLIVQKRVDKGRRPLTLVAFIFSVFEFSWFTFGCLVSYLVVGLLFLMPIPKKHKRVVLNKVLSLSSWSVMYSALHVRIKYYGKENLNLDEPSIIVSNHTSFLDILLMLLIDRRIIIVVKDWVYKSLLFGPIVRYAGFIYVGDGPEENLRLIKKRIADGYSLMIFPEGSRSENDKIRRFHKGAFYIAQELDLDVTPILIKGPSYILPKGEFFVRPGYINLKVLPRIKANDMSWGDTFGRRTKSISKYFKEEYLKFKEEEESANNLWYRVFSNYIYKGPLLEWYLKVKWKLEHENYDHYQSLLREKIKIIDVGCGYGYLSYFLHYKDINREIIGLDYDKEKIDIANRGFDKTESLKFMVADINSYETETCDAIILNDVLHYLSEEEQGKLLHSCANVLSTGGMILIRDGITDLQDRHKMTKLTELFSTKVFSFNKKEGAFHFFSSNYIENFATENGLTFEMVEQSRKTSNVLFILRKE